MSRKRRKTPRNKSIISRRIINPEIELAEFIPQMKREFAQLMGIPVEQVHRIRLLKHQFVVSYKGDNGNTRSQFFSYRKLPIWEQPIADKLERDCPDLEEWSKIYHAMRWEYQWFPYPVAIKAAIDRALEARLYQLSPNLASQTAMAKNL